MTHLRRAPVAVNMDGSTMVAELLPSVAFSATKSASPFASQPPGVEA